MKWSIRAGTVALTLAATTLGAPAQAQEIDVNGSWVPIYHEDGPEPEGAEWFVVTTILRDPEFLGEPWITTSHFKKEPDGSKWNPQACQVR